MTGLLVVGSTVAGAVVGGLLGAWYGIAEDHGDFPILVAFTMPVGALLGGLVGVVAGSAVFT